ncbi:MAG: hypothetical protein Q4C50_08850 [Eubacteriales bacterium]|nr:hypothetical protein [Eubacteriales bacterium]
MKAKKIMSMMMAAVMVVSLTACSGTTKADSGEKTTTEAAAQQETASEAVSEEVKETETETVSETEKASETEATSETEKASEAEAASETETETASEAAENVGEVSLTEDEEELLEMMKDDIIVVTDEDYAETVQELASHTGEFNGQVYQIEGVFTVDGEEMRVSRTLVNGDEETECGLPLIYVEKDLKPESWIRVTGIVNEGEVGKETMNVLEVVAVEALAEAGNASLEWDGLEDQH